MWSVDLSFEAGGPKATFSNQEVATVFLRMPQASSQPVGGEAAGEVACLPICGGHAGAALSAETVSCAELHGATNKTHYSKLSLLSVNCASNCTIPLADAAELRQQITAQQSWLFFVGDSDTRAIVFELLQLLAAGAHGVAHAANHSELWLGKHHRDSSDLPSGSGRAEEWLGRKEREDWMRRCFLDFTFDRHGQLAMPPSTRYCLGDEGTPRPGKDGAYVAPGHDYNLSEQSAAGAAPAAGNLRVTYVGTNTYNQTMLVLDAVTSHLEQLRSRVLPGAIFAGFGAWFKSNYTQGSIAAGALVSKLNRLSNLTSSPHALIYSTVVGMSHRVQAFDASIRPLLGARWQVLERDTVISRRAGERGFRGVRLSSGHAPHLVNYFDVQRLIAADAFMSHRRRGQAHQQGHGAPDEPAKCIPVRRVRYEPWCAGFGNAGGGNTFLEAYWHFCSLEVESHQIKGD